MRAFLLVWGAALYLLTCNSFSRSFAQSAPRATLCQLQGGQFISNLNSTNADVLQRCIDAAKPGDTIELNPGEYSIQKVITISKSITLKTRGLPNNYKCLEDKNFRCAHLKAVSPIPNIQRGFIVVSSSDVTFLHIVVNGNKANRTDGPEARICIKSDNGPGMNLHVNAPNFSFVGSSTINALCGTGMEVTPVSRSLAIENSFAGFNGYHNQYRLWADGITVLQSENAIIKNNVFVDNTDIDLIFGGCPQCQIVGNKIQHSDDFSQSAFAAFMLHAWPNNSTSGNYNNSTISLNEIDCGTKQCGIGILIGANPWYRAPTYGGTYSNNLIKGAQGGLIINDATGSMIIGNNQVVDSGGTSRTSAGRKVLPAYGVSRSSTPFVQFSESAQNLPWQTIDLTGAIPNWWQ